MVTSDYLKTELRSFFSALVDRNPAGPIGRDTLFRFMDGIPAPILITDTESGETGPRILYVNKAFEVAYGYSREECLNSTPRMLQGPETNIETAYEFRKRLERDGEATEQLVNYTKAGEPFVMQVHASKLELGEFADNQLRIAVAVRVRPGLRSIQ